jgi:hypothetical protein
MVPSPDSSIELKLFEQHWLHLRHIEDQRLTLTSVFAAVVGGTLAFFAAHQEGPMKYPILGSLVVFSLFGFVFCLKVAGLHELHKKLGDWRLRLLHHGQFMPLLATRRPKSKWDRYFSIALIFAGIYALCFNVTVGVLLYDIFQPLRPDWKVRVPFGAAAVGLAGFACFFAYAVHYQERSSHADILEPILTVKCPKCSTENTFEFVLWGTKDDEDHSKVKELLSLFVERQHPHHPPRFEAITVKDL